MGMTACRSSALCMCLALLLFWTPGGSARADLIAGSRGIQNEPRVVKPPGYDDGVAAFQGKDYQKAVELLTRAIWLESRYAPAYNFRGLAQNRLGKADEALADYTQAIRHDPRMHVAFFNRGTIYEDKKLYAEAIQDFSRAIELHTKDRDYYNRRGNVHYTQRAYDKAIADYTAAMKIGTPSPTLLTNRGNTYTLAGQADLARADFDAALVLDPKNATARRGLETLNKAAAPKPMPTPAPVRAAVASTVSFDQGVAAYNKQDYDGAEKFFTLALKEKSQDANLWRWRGLARRMSKRYEAAIMDHTEAIRLSPEAAMYHARASDYHAKGDMDQALTDYAAAIKADPTYADAHYGRGNALYTVGQYQKAVDDYSSYLRLNPGGAGALAARGYANLRLSKWVESRTDFESALKADPKESDALAGSAELIKELEGKGNDGESESLQRVLLEVNDKQFGLEDARSTNQCMELAENLRRQGKYKEAVPFFQRVLAYREKTLGVQHFDTALVLNNMAVSLNQLGQYAEAEDCFARAMPGMEKHLGAGNTVMGRVCKNYADILRNTGKPSEAEALYIRALAIYEKAPPDSEVETRTALKGLGLALMQQQKAAEGEAAFRKLLPLQEKASGTEHWDTSMVLYEFSRALGDQKKYAEAEVLAQRALAIQERQPDFSVTDLASTMHQVGFLSYQQKKWGVAEDCFKKTLALLEKAGRDGSSEHLAALAMMSTTLVAQGKVEAAEPVAVRLLTLNARRMINAGANWKNLTYYLESLREVLRAKKLTPPQVEEEVLGQMRQHYPSDHPMIASQYNTTGLAHFRAGDYASSRGHYERALAIFEKRSDSKADIPITRLNLGAALRDGGELEKAERTIIVSLNELTQDATVSPALTARARFHLGMTYEKQQKWADAETQATKSLKGYAMIPDQDSLPEGFLKQTRDLMARLLQRRGLGPEGVAAELRKIEVP